MRQWDRDSPEKPKSTRGGCRVTTEVERGAAERSSPPHGVCGGCSSRARLCRSQEGACNFAAYVLTAWHRVSGRRRRANESEDEILDRFPRFHTYARRRRECTGSEYVPIADHKADLSLAASCCLASTAASLSLASSGLDPLSRPYTPRAKQASMSGFEQPRDNLDM